MKVQLPRFSPIARICCTGLLLAICSVSQVFADSFNLGNASKYAVLFVGRGIHELLITGGSTNFQINSAVTDALRPEDGLTPDEVLSIWAGDSDLSGGPILDIDNHGGSPWDEPDLSEGSFLDWNRPISGVHSNITPRVFRPDIHDSQSASGSHDSQSASVGIPALLSIPEPASFFLLGTGLCSVGIARKLKRGCTL